MLIQETLMKLNESLKKREELGKKKSRGSRMESRKGGSGRTSSKYIISMYKIVTEEETVNLLVRENNEQNRIYRKEV